MKLSLLLAAAFGTASVLSTPQAFAFPEMVRTGYGNCTSCHHSPTGGGVLTQYGRELSREALSAWSTETESDFAYGLIKSPEWLSLGGDIRGVQTYLDTPSFRQGKVIFMHGDLEAASTYKQWTAVVLLGLQQEEFASRRHYLVYHATDQLSLRGGRFFPAYGINSPEHEIPIKKGLGWDFGTESYNLEAAWIDENKNFYLTAILGRLDTKQAPSEKGVAASGSVFLLERHKIGLSYFNGQTDARNRHLAGPFAILGFTKRAFLLSELDLQWSKPQGLAYQQGMVNYQKLDFELLQGLHAYLTQELTRPDFKTTSGLTYGYGAGVQFFPRPHFELNLNWQKLMDPRVSQAFLDSAWFLFHFYP